MNPRQMLKTPCAGCGHPKYEHGKQQGCTFLVLAPGFPSPHVCGCWTFREPPPKPKRTPAQRALARAISGHHESVGERQLLQQLQNREIPFEQEVQAIPGRLFRFDFCFRQARVLVEVEGGVWRRGGGAHSHPENIERDLEKYSLAAIHGWRLVRGSTDAVEDGRLIDWIERALAWRADALDGLFPPAGGPHSDRRGPRGPSGAPR